VKTQTNKQAGSSKVSKEIVEYGKIKTRIRTLLSKDMARMEELEKSEVIQKHFNITPPTVPIDPAEKEQWSKISDTHDSMTNYLCFMNEQIKLLGSAHMSDLDLPQDLSWTFVELQKTVDKIMKLKEQLWDLSNPKHESIST